MNLSNKWTSDLLNKDKNKSKAAAEHILNDSDVEAWKCLIENSEYIFDFIKQKIGNLIFDAINENNYKNIFSFFKYHSPEWDECLVRALSDFSDQDINQAMLDILNNGSEHEKAYAAKYFSYVQISEAADSLFKSALCEYQPLKVNAANALGLLHDENSYNYFLEKLEKGDDWEKVDASQFLAVYGNKNAMVNILRAMKGSGMSEYIAGEAAVLDDLQNYFESSDAELKNLALEGFDNILSGLGESWTLDALLDFKVFETVENLVYLVNNHCDESFLGKYSQLLLKARSKINLLIENDIYKFDQNKDALGELSEIQGLLASQNEKFWNFQIDNINKELQINDIGRKLSAISLVGDLKIKSAFENLASILALECETDVIICETVLSIKKMDMISNVSSIDKAIARIKDPNLLAVAKNALI